MNKKTNRISKNLGIILKVFLIPNLIILNSPMLLFRLSNTSSLSLVGITSLSETILPSCILITRVAKSFISSKLCVTTITNLSFEISFNSLITSLADLLSKLPVGSSATIIGVSFAKALAIATLCF